MAIEQQTTNKPQNGAAAGNRTGGGADRGRGRGTGQPPKRRPPKSEYGRQLEEKQKTRKIYGLREKQFSNYVRKATEKKGVDPKKFLFESLEMRLDSIIYRVGLSGFSRMLARQIVTHGHIFVNGKRVSAPSYHVLEGDEVTVRPASYEKTLFQNALKQIDENKVTPPSWIIFDYKKGSGKLKGIPDYKESGLALDLVSVLEFYSR